MSRNDPFYTMTLMFPILVLTLLSPIGLILPVDAGEKMGLQITVLLTMVIYVDILQSTVPVFDGFGQAPLLLDYFIVTIIMLCVCLLVSTHTLFLYHASEYESHNFTQTEARISRNLAKIFDCMACNLWEIRIPHVRHSRLDYI